MKRFLLVLLLLAGQGLLAAQASANPFSREVAPQDVVDRALETVESMAGDPDYAALLPELEKARGVLIFPRVVRGGFLIGGAGGLGVFLAWDEERGDYSPVAFYSLGAVSFGMQFGGEAAEVVMVARTQDAVDSLFGSAFRLGGDASVAAGPAGAGRSATVNADFVSFARSRGAFLGMSLEGSRLTVRDDFNEAYYGEPRRPVHIIESRRVDHDGTRALRERLADYRGAADAAPARPDQPLDGVAPGEGGLEMDEIQVESF